MYVRIKVWPNTIEYFARAYVYYLNMDQNIATKHTTYANFWTVGEIVVRVCVCVRCENFKQAATFIASFILYGPNTMATTTHTF